MSRKKARDFAFKLIFEIPFFENKSNERLDNFYDINQELTLDEKDCKYLESAVKNCFENIDIIDGILTKNLKNWTLDRIPNVAKAILRLSVCEINYIDDVPYQVAINEAIELAKKYGDDDTPSFVNGVLASIVKSEKVEG